MSIPTRMYAVVAGRPQIYPVDGVPLPQVGPRKILIDVATVDICAFDMKSITGGELF